MLTLLLACTPAKILLDDSGPAGDADTDTDTDTDTDADTDTDTDTDTIADLSASVHPDMESIVVLEWTQPAAGVVQAEYSADDGDWLATPEYPVGAGSRRLLLLGVPFDATVTWRLLLDGTAVQADATLETGRLPSGVPEVDRLEGEPDGWDTDTRWVLISLAPQGGASRPWTFIIDRAGRVVWAHQTSTGRTTFAPRPSADGTAVLIDYNSWWGSFDGGVNSEVVALDIEDAEVDRTATPGLIHPFTQLEDGTLVWSAAQGGGSYSGENLDWMTDRGPEELFDCNAFARAHGGDNCGANAITFDTTTGHYLYSLYTLDTVIELSAAGEPVRWFGQLEGAWAFADADSTFWWQHGAHFLPDGHLLLSARRTEDAEETVVREYRLDEADEALVEVWSFGEGEGVYAEILGEARRLPGGNTLHNYGNGARLREATPAGDVVWDAQWDNGGTMGCSWPLSELYGFWRGVP